MTELSLPLPDYDGAWIGGIVPGLLGGPRPSWFPSPLATADTAVLLVLDGLGWEMIQAHPEVMPTLRGMTGGAVTCAGPTTTAAGLTSIATGLPPSVHGVVGYRMRVGGEVLNVLQWRTAAGERGPDPAGVQPHDGFGGRPVPIVTRADFAGSGFTEAHLRNGRFDGWKTTAMLVERTMRAVADGEPFVYAYYDGVDKVAHEHGLHDSHLTAELAAADRLVASLIESLPATCALAVTADHGHVHVGPAGMRDLDAVRHVTAAYAGEGRFRSLFAGPGGAARLLQAARDAYSDEAYVLTRDEVWDLGMLGPDVAMAVRGRIGDVVLLARSDVAYVAPDLPGEASLLGCHGSFTPAELEVPLLAALGCAG